MRPYGLDEFEQLRYARAHAEQLKEDWRQANAPAKGRRRGGVSGAPHRVRRSAGNALIELGRRLLPADAASRRVAVAAHRPDWGC